MDHLHPSLKQIWQAVQLESTIEGADIAACGFDEYERTFRDVFGEGVSSDNYLSEKVARSKEAVSALIDRTGSGGKSEQKWKSELFEDLMLLHSALNPIKNTRLTS